MTTAKLFSAVKSAAMLAAIVVAGSSSLAKQSATPTVEVRISDQEGLAQAIFHTPSGGKVVAFFPLGVEQDEAQIGGTVERQLPPKTNSQNLPELTDEISGVVTVEEKNKTPKVPPVPIQPNQSNFSCTPPSDGNYLVTYLPSKGPPCSTTVSCPAPSPATPVSTDTCSIPQLVNSNGNLPVSMGCPADASPGDSSCAIGGKIAPLRAWSKKKAVFHVPSASQIALGPKSVVVRRGRKMAIGQTHVAQVKMICFPDNLQPGQPCTITTTVNCPGLKDVTGGILTIKNWNPSVLNMADKVVPIPTNPNANPPNTSDLVKRDGLQSIDDLKQKLANSPQASTPEGQTALNKLNEMQQRLSK